MDENLSAVCNEFLQNLEEMGVRDYLVIVSNPDKPSDWFSRWNNRNWVYGTTLLLVKNIELQFEHDIKMEFEEGDD